MVSVGTIVWLSSELMFFAGLFAMYFTARSQAGGNWPPEPTELNLVQAVPVTLVLIASSFTCQMGVFAAERGDVFGLRRWYVITFFMGLFFVLGQGYEYIHLVQHGTTLSSSAYGSVFYLATGFHGLHQVQFGGVGWPVAGGLSAGGEVHREQAGKEHQLTGKPHDGADADHVRSVQRMYARRDGGSRRPYSARHRSKYDAL